MGKGKRYKEGITKKKTKIRIVNKKKFTIAIVILLALLTFTFALFRGTFANTFSAMLGTFEIDAQIKINGVAITEVRIY